MEDNLILLLKQLNISLDQYSRSQMKRLPHADLSPSQGFVLDYLFSQRGGIVYATDLHEKFRISKAAISSILKDLKQKGYLEMAANPEDDRKKQLLLTPKAYAVHEEIDAFLLAQQRQLCRGIPPQHLAVIAAGLRTMIANVRQHPQGAILHG